MDIALIAHDRKKDQMVALAREFQPFLARCHLMATGTTGARLIAEAGLEVERLLSGPMGGDVHDVVCATNLSSARHVLRALAAELDEAAQKR
jgi:methylglyoxal synthase